MSSVQAKGLFTNSDTLPDLMEQRSAFSCTRGTDLDSLIEDDFKAIDSWLRGSFVRPPPKEPRSYQVEALDAILKGLEGHDRGGNAQTTSKQPDMNWSRWKML